MTDNLVEMTTVIVGAYVENNKMDQSALPDLIRSVYSSLKTVGQKVETVSNDKPMPAVAVKKSILPDFLICLEDGRKFKSLKRHLRTKYEMSPEQYREKWGLPKDYPMVAPNYAAARSALAKEAGLGLGGRQAPATKPEGKSYRELAAEKPELTTEPFHEDIEAVVPMVEKKPVGRPKK